MRPDQTAMHNVGLARTMGEQQERARVLTIVGRWSRYARHHDPENAAMHGVMRKLFEEIFTGSVDTDIRL